MIESRITDPAAAQPGDIPGNLAKLAYRNTAGEVFQLRTAATAPWREPVLTLDKSASPTANLNGGETVDYTITIPNTGNQDAVQVEVWDTLPPSSPAPT